MKRYLYSRPGCVRYFFLRHSTAHILLALCILFTSFFLAGCSRNAPKNSQSSQDEIIVAAAANLSDAFVQLGAEFTARTGIRVVYSFGASGDLARQIENNAPFDVFASADVENVERLERSGLLTSGTRKLYARGRLVLWIPPGSHVKLTSLNDLIQSDVERIGIAKPDIAPYGRASVESLRALKLWPQIESKVIYGQNVLQVRQYAATGNVDAAFIPLTLVHAGDGYYLEVDEKLHQPINQAIAVIKESRKQDAATRFLEFVIGPDGQALLQRSGYGKP